MSSTKITCFRERFCELLASSSRSDAVIARELGVSKQALSTWKTGAHEPKNPAKVTIARYFGVNADWLDGCDVPKNETNSSVLTHVETLVIVEKTKAAVFSRLLFLAGYNESVDEDANVTIYKDGISVSETPELVERIMDDIIDYFSYRLEKEGKR